jgi:hypothetical protein
LNSPDGYGSEPGESCDDRGALEQSGVADESWYLAEALAG